MPISIEEHDYIGLSKANMEKKTSAKINNQDFNLKATELRLGFPGSESPESDDINGALKNLASGAKRGFSDAINGGSSKWGFADNGRSELELVKNGGLYGENKKSEAATKPSLFEKKTQVSASKAQVVGWPPIRSFRKNTMAANHTKNENDDFEANLGPCCQFVKVSMDGAPYLRKIDLKMHSSYKELSLALEKMFSCFTIGQYGSQGIHTQEGLSKSRIINLLHGSEYVLTYEDIDDDWMLVGDVPWDMFISSCKRMRITKSSDAVGLGKVNLDFSKENQETP